MINVLNDAIAGTSSSSNGVFTKVQRADGSYQQWQMLFDKLDELINALRR